MSCNDRSRCEWVHRTDTGAKITEETLKKKAWSSITWGDDETWFNCCINSSNYLTSSLNWFETDIQPFKWNGFTTPNTSRSRARQTLFNQIIEANGLAWYGTVSKMLIFFSPIWIFGYAMRIYGLINTVHGKRKILMTMVEWRFAKNAR